MQSLLKSAGWGTDHRIHTTEKTALCGFLSGMDGTVGLSNDA